MSQDIIKKETILLVDDSKSNIDILMTLLDDYDLIPVLDGKTAIDIAIDEDIDLILLDIVMPDISGFDVCRILKENTKTKNIPILFITAKTDHASIQEGFEIGGQDYITKPFKSFELIARIKTHLKLNQTLKSLDYLATRDYMTGIYNRRKFFELAVDMFNSSENIFAVMIDIDKFKNINDTYGHPFGDIIIKSVASTISKQLSSKDLFARFGGEEFVLLSEADSMEDMVNKVESLRKIIEELEEKYEDKIVKFTISNGISQKNTNKEMSIDNLLYEADKALYEAKDSGRNKVCFRV